ncbi:astacin-like metalloprotease toxin 2 [Toxorhynchites rutilus septentrionalis]|uniref:astacin-like metalloprotease toxin 2 n=1 Tax=Toxorhynchites rutilus septentrionalis TaxID=329112 RepID=UPI00247AEA85|nr:astacin-like metalloprotease toxin 2 [Toxorhynchites rutilus septentrionalis]XP_055644269.1 astacin-like metalloprotease toxin 2 [Toxorhynchites rutilus septentrionalis]
MLFIIAVISLFSFATDKDTSEGPHVKSCNDLKFSVKCDNLGSRQVSSKYGNKISNFLPENYKWPNATVYYDFDGVFSHQELHFIKQAMDQISANSCVLFLKKTNQAHHIEITSEDSGCWADTGYQSQKTQVNFGPTCLASLATPLHELMHTLGFLHQHTRPDRDQYIEILYENVIQRPEILFNFEIIEPWTELLFPLPYDYDSIMHYNATMFSRDPEKLQTIVPREPKIKPIGQRDHLSAFDIIAINLLYCL